MGGYSSQGDDVSQGNIPEVVVFGRSEVAIDDIM